MNNIKYPVYKQYTGYFFGGFNVNITATHAGGRLVIALCGELDHHAARSVMHEIGSRIDIELPRDCILDMSELSFMDSSGIAVVLKAYKRMQEIGGHIRLENVRQQPMRVFDASGIGRMIDILAFSEK